MDPYGDDLPAQLWDGWHEGRFDVDYVRETLPTVWLNRDNPQDLLPAARWVELLRATGFLAVPADLAPLPSELTVYRGATVERRRQMAWYLERAPAENIRHRQEHYGPTYVWSTRVKGADVLAHFRRPDEAEEVLVDPATLGQVESG
jgi:hypothetical protein